MSLLDKLKNEVDKEDSIQEISGAMLERVGKQIAGNAVWCRAQWGSGCDFVNIAKSPSTAE